jgi:hypothetical protein
VGEEYKSWSSSLEIDLTWSKIIIWNYVLKLPVPSGRAV